MQAKLGLLVLLALVLSPAEAVVQADIGNLCTTFTKNTLKADILDCFMENALPVNDEHTYTVAVPPAANFDLSVVLRSMRGDADLTLVAANGETQHSTERVGEEVLYVSRFRLRKMPGNLTLTVHGFSSWNQYQLQILTTSLERRLSNDDVALFRDLVNECCDLEDEFVSAVCQRLDNATKPINRDPQYDLCAQAPNVCNEQGQLIKLALVGGETGNLACDAFPKSIARFTRLEVLDLSYNSLLGTLSEAAAALAPLTNLRRLYLRDNNLEGPFNCSIIGPNLELLWLNFNMLNGAIPPCALASPTLKQLELTDNYLDGTIPDLPPNSPLVVLDLSNNGAGAEEGLVGTIPATVINAARLSYLDVSLNTLSGSIPPLPAQLSVFAAADNLLTGELPESLGTSLELKRISVQGNRLSGSLPQGIADTAPLSVLELQDNKFKGAINFRWNTPFLKTLNLTNNGFSGEFPYTLAREAPLLTTLDVANNNLTGDLTAFASQLAPGSRITVFNVAGNQLRGSLEAGLAQLGVFTPQPELPKDPLLNEDQQTPYQFDVSGNQLSGPFPTWLYNALVAPLASNLLAPTIKLYGTGNSFTCPSSSAGVVDKNKVSLVDPTYAFTCTSTTGARVRVSTTLTSGPTPRASSPPTGGDGGKPGGSVAAAVIVPLIIVGAVGGGVYWWIRRRNRPRRFEHYVA